MPPGPSISVQCRRFDKLAFAGFVKRRTHRYICRVKRLWVAGFFCLAFSLPAAGAEEVGRGSAGRQPELPLKFPALGVRDSNGNFLPLFSLAAYRAEFRYLQRVYHQIDLAGPAVETDGWTHNIPETEWLLLGLSYFGYAYANLAQHDPGFREETLAEMRWLIEAMQTPRVSGFITPHLGVPFGTNRLNASTFVHGHFLNLALRYREVSGDKQYNALLQRVATALAQEFDKTDQGILRSYRDMWWITDNCPSLAALSRYDRLFHTHLSEVKARFLKSLKAYYLDPATGLLCTFVDPSQRRQLQGARGVSVMYALHFFPDIDPAMAAEQYTLAKRYLIRDGLGFAAVREFPEGVEPEPDVASGPIFLGVGLSASGFAIPAAALQQDRETAWALLKASALVGGPSLQDGELHYSAMPPVGQAVVLFGKTLLRAPEDAPR